MKLLHLVPYYFLEIIKTNQLIVPLSIFHVFHSSKKELLSLINKLVVENKPTKEYKDMLERQREWLYENGTTVARAKYILNVLNKYSD